MARISKIIGLSAIIAGLLALYTCNKQVDDPRDTSINPASTEPNSSGHAHSRPFIQSNFTTSQTTNPRPRAQLKMDFSIEAMKLEKSDLRIKNEAQYLCTWSIYGEDDKPITGRIYLNTGDERQITTRDGESFLITGGDDKFCTENPLRGLFDSEDFRNIYLGYREYQTFRDLPRSMRKIRNPFETSNSLIERISALSITKQETILCRYDDNYKQILSDQLSEWRENNPQREQMEIIECMEEQLRTREYTEEGLPQAFGLYTCIPQ